MTVNLVPCVSVLHKEPGAFLDLQLELVQYHDVLRYRLNLVKAVSPIVGATLQNQNKLKLKTEQVHTSHYIKWTIRYIQCTYHTGNTVEHPLYLNNFSYHLNHLRKHCINLYQLYFHVRNTHTKLHFTDIENLYTTINITKTLPNNKII